MYSPHTFIHTTQEHRQRPGRTARRALTLGIERGLAPLARAIVCVSRAERDSALRDRVAPESKLHVVLPGVPAPRPAEPPPELRARSERGPLVGWLARFDPLKGPLDFVEALAELDRRGTLPAAAMVGDGPLAPAAAGGLAAAGLAGRVPLLPYPGSTGACLAAFDVLVLSSRVESLPVGILEAMAAGLPVVATDVGGVREAVEDGVTGLVVQPGSAGAMADAIQLLAGDAALRAKLGGAGRERWRQTFRPEDMAERAEALYARAVAAR